jgi:site-specific DNA recombinase
MSQWERETIAERVVEGMTKKYLTGERNGGKAPFGYDVVDGKLVINPQEAKVVKEVYRMYLNGSGLREIVLFMGHLGSGAKDLRNVSRMLDNPVYCGMTRWNKNSKRDEIIQENTHPAIIDPDTFNRAQELRKVRRIDGKASTSVFHFSGILRCGRCGGAISGWYRKNRDVKQYICVTKKNKRTCNLPIFNEDTLIKNFLSNITSDDPEQFFTLLQSEDHTMDMLEDNSDLIEEIEKELVAIKKRKKNWLLALGNGTISQEEYSEMVAEDNKKEIGLKNQLETLAPKQPTFNRDDFLTAMENIPELWETASDYEKKSFLSALFEKIIVDIPHGYISKGPGKNAPVEIIGVELKHDQ